jgi:hypothetical protein
MDVKKPLFDLLEAAQNDDPDRLNDSRNQLLENLWGRVRDYRFTAVNPGCVERLQRALKSDRELHDLARGQIRFPY